MIFLVYPFIIYCLISIYEVYLQNSMIQVLIIDICIDKTKLPILEANDAILLLTYANGDLPPIKLREIQTNSSIVYHLIDGNRRLKAAQMANHTHISAQLC